MGAKTERKVIEYVKQWQERCYSGGIPDEAPFPIKDKVPNYKSIALAILSNDLHLTDLGFKAPESKYYGILKRIEISARTNIQLKLFK